MVGLSPIHHTRLTHAGSGEVNLTKGAAQSGIIQIVSSNASLSYSDIIEATAPSQVIFFQLYKHANDAIAEQRVREVERLGYKAIFLTVDAIVAGNRERDIRNPWELEDEERGTPQYWSETGPTEEVVDGMGTAGALIANDDRNMTWEKVHRPSSIVCR